MKPVLFGCEGLTLSEAERAFFARVRPFGLILFKRNCDAPDQIRALVRDFRACVENPEAPVFIDQEGGRVARLKPPHWMALPPMKPLGDLYDRDPVKAVMAMRLHAALTCSMLRDLEIDGNCAPVLDLYLEGMSTAIGDRAFAGRPQVVAALGRVAIDTYLAHGVMPVIKHLPGHGRVKVDPHEVLPFVDADLATLQAQDFAPFKALKDAPCGMNCHVVFRAIDPENPVSLSAKAHREILRGEIGFEGFLFSDDLAMGALSDKALHHGVCAEAGSDVSDASDSLSAGDGACLGALARKALAAGADVVLYCAGTLPEMAQIAEALPEMDRDTCARWDLVAQRRGVEHLTPKQIAKAKDELDALMIEAAQAAPRGEADLVVALEGFDGPIDLLLNLARDQKVDLAGISILALAEQYLAFIASARKLRLEVAADYLVMAAWLAYLKSRLLLPEPPKDEPDPVDMADALKFQLQRLAAMQTAAKALQDLPQIGSDVFLRGMPPSFRVEEKPLYYLPLYDLLAALAAPLRRQKPQNYAIQQTRLFSLEESMTRLRRLLGGPDWGVLADFLPEVSGEARLEARSAIASTFAATLELVKAGELELRQDGTFAPIYLRRREPLSLPDVEVDVEVGPEDREIQENTETQEK